MACKVNDKVGHDNEVQSQQANLTIIKVTLESDGIEGGSVIFCNLKISLAKNKIFEYKKKTFLNYKIEI